MMKQLLQRTYYCAIKSRSQNVVRGQMRRWCLLFAALVAMQFAFQATGQINNTLRIIQVHAPDPSCDECGNSAAGADCEYRIEVENTTGFNAGDRVLIVQMKGATIDTDNTSPTAGNITDIGDAGNYEFFVIGRIEGNFIYPRGRLKRTYNETGLIQLVQVASYNGDHTINSDITATAWDPVAGQGGVVAIFVEGTLTLNANINAEGKGYQGVTYDVSMKGKDNNSINPANYMVLPSTNIDVTTKGQGVVVDDPNTNGGRAPRANGGGGGIAGDTGGGGGSNYGRGGNGGNRWNEFTQSAGGIGGVSMQSYMATNRIYFGGAGGAGYVTNDNASSAANGGGLVVIRAKKIISNGAVINASGTSPQRLIGSDPYDGGGGGGGGGSVAFEIQEFEGSLTVNVSGGNGQDLATTTYHGPGGGGGGGAFLYNLASLPAGITVNSQGGIGGEHTDGHRNGSQDGADGGIVSYFNFVYSEEDSDNDNISDFCDLDTDNDGILDADEDGQTGTDPSKDDDNDNVPNYKDSDLVAADGRGFIDDNGDGVNDLFDRDKDGIPDFKDLDSDNDGRPDAIEAGGTVDQSGKYGVFPDTNINGLNDAVDASVAGGVALILVDSDGDGSPDFVDTDSDNDGVNDAYESLNSSMPVGVDDDNDGIDNAFDADSGGEFNALTDRDGDGIDDIFDIDSDNDGITDYYETAGISSVGFDSDFDGIVDVFDVDVTNGADLNKDGIDDASNPQDTDIDGLFDIHDLDADADGIVDNIEGQTTVGYRAPTGIDADGDGLDNAYDADNGGVIIVPSNVDGDDKPDFIDSNSDEDSESDIIEAHDINRDGISDITPAGVDSDNDGIDNAFDKTAGNDPTDGGELATDYPDVDDPGDDRDWRQNLPRVSLVVDKPILREDAQVATITFMLSETTYQSVTIPLTYDRSSAVEGLGGDYTAAPKTNAPDIFSVVIPAGQLFGEITFTSIDDAEDEEPETIIIDMGAVAGAKVDGDNSKTITIADNDAAGYTVSAISNTVSEDGSTATFSVVLNSAPTADVVLDLTISADDLTEAGIDAVGNELTFKVGDWNVPQIVTVTGIDDLIVDGDQLFDIIVGVKSSADGNYSGLGTQTISGTNKDNDVPLVSFDAASSNGLESVNNANLPVSISAMYGLDVSIDYTITGTASGTGIDYTLADGTLTIAAGKTTENIVIANIVNDLLDENNETIIVTLTNPVNATLGSNIIHTYTITDDDDAPNVTLSVDNATIAENGGVAAITANIDAISGLPVIVKLAYSGTATLGGTDVTIAAGINANSSAEIVIPAGSTSGTVTITAVQDVMDEADETVIVDIDNVVNATEASPQQVTTTITDDDNTPVITFAAASSAGDESVSSADLQVDLSAASGLVVSVDYSITGTATGTGVDYTLANGTLTLPAGTTTDNITIAGIVDDLLDEDNETVVVTLSNPVNATLGANAVHTYTITDNDNTPVITFVAASSDGDESVNSADLEVDLSAASGLVVSVDYSITGTATGTGVDYTLANGTLTIPAGTTTNNITITRIVDDLLDEDNETLVVTLSNPVNATLGANAVHTYTITDNDITPVITFASASSDGDESVNSADLEVDLSAASGLVVSVDYSVTGTATGTGVDYTLANGSLTLPAGTTTDNITIAGIVDDLLDEDNETVVVTLSNSVNATLGANAVHTYTITDNDNTPVIAFATASSDGDESVNSADLQVDLSAASGLVVSVDYSITGTATGTGVDYTLANGTLTLPAGTTTDNITISGIVDDLLDEDNETVVVTLSNPVNATLGANAVHTYTITDNDNTPVITFATASSVGDESVNSADLQIDLSAASGLVVSVDYSVTGTATGTGVDYTLANRTLTLPAGTTTDNITISGIVDDLLDEDNETVVVTLSNPVNATLGANAVHTYTITDNDNMPNVTLSVDKVVIAEDGGVATVTASIDAVSGLPVTIALAYSGTATLDGTDATTAAGTNANSATEIVIPAGSTSGAVTITSAADAIYEGIETIIIDVDNVVNAAEATAQQKIVEITDGQSQPTVTLELTGSPFSENGGAANIKAVLSHVSVEDVQVEVTLSGTAAVTDYNATPLNLIIPALATEATITLTGVNDIEAEGDETVIADITNVVNGSEDGVQQVTAIISDDDVAGLTVVVSGGSNETSEDKTTDSFEVVLNTQPANDVVINITGLDATEGELSATSLTFTNADWDQAQMVTITGKDDNLIDGTIDYVLTLVVDNISSDDAYDDLSTTTTVRNLDNDVADFTLSKNTLSTNENGATDDFTIVLTAEPVNNVVLLLSESDDEGTVVSPVTFTPANWNKPQTVVVTPEDDLIVDGDQTYDITISVDAANSDDGFDLVTSKTISVTNIDNDTAGLSVTQSDGSTGTSESGASDSFDVVLNTQPISNVVINISGIDATEGSVDVTSLTFTPANWNIAQTVTVTGQNDSEIDGDINYTLKLSVDNANSDDAYDGLSEVVEVTNIDDDSANSAPFANDDIASIQEGDVLNGTSVLNNDSDPDNHNLVVNTTPVVNVTHGTLVLNVDGSFVYTPNHRFFGTDSFTYEVCDDASESKCATATVTITVTENTDRDNDGIDNDREGDDDLDGDGIPNDEDEDADGDGILDSEEGDVDTDGDGTPDYMDLDSDNDGILDEDEGNGDTDGDGLEDYRDEDSDGDGILDVEEGDVDTDGDGTPDYKDLDSDDDGMLDEDEGNGDTDGDGLEDYRDEDSDGDGILDSEEGDVDTDGDGTPDYKDLDSDDDGILDEDEGNGDTDGDGLEDYRDEDSDGDGILDVEEGDVDTDGDGTPDYKDLDSDDDGILDEDEGNGDTDGDGLEDYRDEDSDGDGILDVEEGDVDTDGDGTPDYKDLDSDDDGVLDADESNGDCDRDGIPDRIDEDKCYDDLEVLEGFSPNGDGVNDNFIIAWLDQYNKVSFEVFNRWGNIVYRKDKYQNDWNGMSNVGFSIGDELPIGTYYYIIVVEDTGEKLQGYIYLNR